MRKLADRQKGILEILTEKEYVTSETLSFHFNVSTRTIKEDIKQLKLHMRGYGADILGYPSKGYILEVSESTRFNEYLQNVITKRFSLLSEVPSERRDRQNYILAKLLTVDFYIGVDDLAEELYVDRTTLLNDLRQIRETLDKYKLKLHQESAKGLKVIGNEVSFRLCISERVFNFDYNSTRSSKYKIKNNIDKKEYDSLSNILYKVLEKYTLKLSYESFKNFVYHMIISKNRWTFYNYVSANYSLYDEVKDTVFLEAGVYLISLIEEEYSKVLPYEESMYFALHFMTKRILSKDENKNVEDNNKLVYGFLGRIREFFNVDFSSDLELYNSLIHHFPVMISRLKMGFNIRNPKMYEYSRMYLFSLLMVEEGSKFLEEETGYHLDRNEKSYLVLYINLSLRKLTTFRDVRVLFVGNGSRSEDSLDYYEFLDMSGLSTSEVDKIVFDGSIVKYSTEYDLIVSNIIGYKVSEMPFINVAKEYNKSDIISELEKQSWGYDDIIKKDAVQLVVDCYTQDHLLRFRQSKNMDNFIELGSNSAVSYTFNSDDKTSLNIYILNRPILHNSQYVQIIFDVKISRNFNRGNVQILSDLSNMISDGLFLADLLSSPSVDKIIKYLNLNRY